MQDEKSNIFLFFASYGEKPDTTSILMGSTPIAFNFTYDLDLLRFSNEEYDDYIKQYDATEDGLILKLSQGKLN
jgi:hypothetical protein